MARAVLLDTCAAIWLMNGDRLSAATRTLIDEAQAMGLVKVSPITAWEVATLAAKGRIALSLSPSAWFAALIGLGVVWAPMPPEVLIASATLPGAAPRDPADRIIAATARQFGYLVVTRDGALLPYAEAGHIAALAC